MDKEVPYKRSGVGSSDYYGISWHSTREKWQAAFKHEGLSRWCGYYEDELDAAMAINKKCDELGIPHKNPNIGVGDISAMPAPVEISEADDEVSE